MDKPDENYVVAIVESGADTRFYATDPTSGGYPWYPDRLKSADIFTDKQKAIDVAVGFGNKSNTPQKPDRHGVISPDTEIKSALGICDKKKSAKGEAVVMKIVLEVVESVPIHGEIKEPTGFTYD